MTKRRRGRSHRPGPKPAAPVLTAEQQSELLRKIGDGLDPATALLELGVDEQLVWSDPQLAAKIQATYDIVTDRVGNKALTRAVRDGSLHIMERELERRRQRAAELRRRAAAAAGGSANHGGLDAGVAERLDQISVAEMEVVEWLLAGEGPRPERLMTYQDAWVRFRREEKAAAKAAAAARPVPDWEVIDPSVPIERGRAVVPLYTVRRD